MENKGEIKDPYWLAFLPFWIRRKLSGRIILNQLLNNSGWLLFDRFTRAIMGLLVSTWVARYLGPTKYGEISYILVYLGFFQAFTNLGLDGIVVREIARNIKNANIILGTTYVLRAISGIIFWMLAIAISVYINGLQGDILIFTAISGGILFFASFDTIDLWFQSRSQNQRTVIAKLTGYLIINGLKILFIALNFSLTGFIFLLLFDSILSAASLVIAYQNFKTNERWKFSLNTAKILLNESWIYIISGIAVTTYMRADQLMVNYYLGSEKLGVYAAALPLSAIWNMLAVSICISLSPILTKVLSEDEFRYRYLIVRIFRYFWMISTSIAILMALLSNNLIDLLYGKNYHGSVIILRIYIFTIIPVFLGMAQTLWVINERKPSIILKNTLLGGITSVGLNMILIPTFGLEGAAITAVISYSVSSVLANAIFAPKLFFMQLGLKVKN